MKSWSKYISRYVFQIIISATVELFVGVCFRDSGSYIGIHITILKTFLPKLFGYKLNLVMGPSLGPAIFLGLGLEF